jgi:hypothetical protein
MTNETDNLEDLRKIDLPFDIDNVDPQCIKCVRNQLKKYEKYAFKDETMATGKFLVPCTGIPKHIIDPTVKSSLTDDQLEDYMSVIDPITFAKRFIQDNKGNPWIARDPHQVEVLKCTSRRRVLRISRRTGKTALVVVDIIFNAYTNKKKKILVIGPQKKHTQEVFNRIKEIIYANPILSDSVVTDVTAPHPKIVFKNGTEIRGFAGGAKGKGEGLAVRGEDADLIYCFPKGTLVSTSVFGVRPIESLRLKDTILGGNQEGIQIGEITNLLLNKGQTMTLSTALGKITCTPDHPLFNGKEDIPAKQADSVIFSLAHQNLTFSKEVILARLLGFVYGDGWASQKSIGFSGQPEDLEQVIEDLSLLGDIRHKVSSRTTENKKRNIKGFGAEFHSQYLYPILKDFLPQGKKVYQPIRVPKHIMNGLDYLKTSFLSGLFSAEATSFKFQKNGITPRSIELKMCSSKENWIRDWFKDISTLLADIGIDYSLKFKYFFDEYNKESRYYGIIKVFGEESNLLKYANKIGYCYNYQKTIDMNSFLAYSHYKKIWKQKCWRRNRIIRKYENCSSSEAARRTKINKATIKYHRSHDIYNNLYSENLLTCKEYINKITWKENFVVLPIYKQSTRYNQEEPLVDVYNLTSTASNRYFASGIFTHNCEEAAYIEEDSFKSVISPILYTTPEVKLTAFSTPAPFRNTFYQYCKENPIYKEYHYNYKVLPWWKQIEQERENLTEDQWKTEYLAEFPEGDAGVYKPSYIDRALKTYLYSEIQPHMMWRYVMGVDWNEKHGAEIVVIGYNPLTRRYQVVEAECIESSEFTQLKSVDKVIELNKKWRPSFVYIDSGNGSTNAELLRKTAQEHSMNNGDFATAKLLMTLRKYDSGASITTRDPITNEKLKKPAKSFMVNAAVRMFEQGLINISTHDHILEKQLRNYIIERMTPTGNPVYGLQEPKVLDHRLDAFNLACVGFQLEFNDLHVVQHVNRAGAALDPRIIQTNEKGQKELIKNVPEQRSMDTIKTPLEAIAFPYLPGRVDTLEGIRTNRLGWDTDQEELEKAKFIQRRRSHDKIRGRFSKKPKRTNI